MGGAEPGAWMGGAEPGTGRREVRVRSRFSRRWMRLPVGDGGAGRPWLLVSEVVV